MKRIALFLAATVLLVPEIFAFCGFFVAKADSKLFNKSSQVILVREANRTVITMSNDYQGAVKEFAMVVPVPVILQENQIRTIDQSLFTKVDNYSAPRLAEYYDDNPCIDRNKYYSTVVEKETLKMSAVSEGRGDGNKYNGVTIEAVYAIDEYDILILSAKESTGLKNWLTDNGYKIPEQAEEVLDPYIFSDMKFFVAKVNLKRHEAAGSQLLSPIQIEFNSDKFMLPIRLGMANANGDQDLIVHAYTNSGRIECTNYRTAKVPHDVHIPEFVKDDFGSFYKKTFDRIYTQENQNSVLLEYAWDVSPRVRVKCDPCVGPPPINQNLATAGINWLNEQDPKVFYTRLHVRYNRTNFPQDLMFQVTPNQERFQARYVITHPAVGRLNCAQGQEYLKALVIKRENELQEYAALTGEDISQHKEYVEIYRREIKGSDDDGYVPDTTDPIEQNGALHSPWMIWIIAGTALLILIGLQHIRKPKTSK